MSARLAFDPVWGEQRDEVDHGLPAGSVVPAPPSRVLLAAFIQRVQEEHRVTVPTIEAYTLDLTVLARWASGQHKGLGDLGTHELVRYLDQRRKHGVRPTTLARYLSSYRRFYSFLLAEGVVAANPAACVEGMRVTRNAQPLLSNTTIARLMRPPVQGSEHAGAGYRTQRDHAIVCMLFGTGLAISAVRQLRWQQVDAQKRIVSLALRKGSPQVFPLDDALLAALATLRVRIAAGFVHLDTPFCFPTAAGQPMTRQGLGQVVQRRAQECGVRESVTPSAIRHAGRAHQAVRWSLRPAISHEALERHPVTD